MVIVVSYVFGVLLESQVFYILLVLCVKSTLVKLSVKNGSTTV